MNIDPEISKLRILELGDYYHFKLTYPERTTLVWTGWKMLPPKPLVDMVATPHRVRKALADVRQGRYDVVVAYAPRYSPWHPRYWARTFAREPWHPWSALTRAFGTQRLHSAELGVPLIVADLDDAFPVGRSALSLIDKASVFFKRELPVDRWQVLCGTVHRHIPTLRYRHDEAWIRRIDKLRPMTHPQFFSGCEVPTDRFPEKTSDIFFAGTVKGNSTVRSDGLRELEALRERGIKVDIPDKPLEPRDFYDRMSRAWLAWSPEGLGWQCNRHYEAARCQAVPVINFPTVLRHAPLVEGVHAFHYAPEPGELSKVVIAALEDKNKLVEMAKTACAHALAHHTVKACCDFMLEAAVQEHRRLLASASASLTL